MARVARVLLLAAPFDYAMCSDVVTRVVHIEVEPLGTKSILCHRAASAFAIVWASALDGAIADRVAARRSQVPGGMHGAGELL